MCIRANKIKKETAPLEHDRQGLLLSTFAATIFSGKVLGNLTGFDCLMQKAGPLSVRLLIVGMAVGDKGMVFFLCHSQGRINTSFHESGQFVLIHFPGGKPLPRD